MALGTKGLRLARFLIPSMGRAYGTLTMACHPMKTGGRSEGGHLDLPTRPKLSGFIRSTFILVDLAVMAATSPHFDFSFYPLMFL